MVAAIGYVSILTMRPRCGWEDVNLDEIDNQRAFFGEAVRKYFGFLSDSGMIAREIYRTGGSYPDAALVARYEAPDLRIDICWGNMEQVISVMLKYNNHHLSDDQRYVYFEPFVEFLSKGQERAIVPMVTEHMDLPGLRRLTRQREALFAGGFEPVMQRVGEKLMRSFDTVRSASSAQILAYQAWWLAAE